MFPQMAEFPWFLWMISIHTHTHTHTHTYIYILKKREISQFFYSFIYWWKVRLLPFLDVRNNIVNIGVQLSFFFFFSVFISFECIPRSKIAGLNTEVLYLTFWGSSILFSVSGYASLQSLFSTSSPAFISCLLYDEHSVRCKVKYCGCGLHFPND